MTSDQQQIAIAKACGYVVEQVMDEPSTFTLRPQAGTRHYYDTELEAWADAPDYLHDLNAMHEAEQILTSSAKWTAYNAKLFSVAAGINLAAGVNRPESLWLFHHATAAQRAEAFLRTINKWQAACQKPKDK